MPSDPRVALALTALRPRIEAFRSAVAAAHERAQSLLSAGGGAGKAAEELGAFAMNRIDAGRFAAIHAGQPALDAASRSIVSQAVEILGSHARAANDAFVVDVPPGGSLPDFVAAALGRLGRSFGAAAVVELVKSGRFSAATNAFFLDFYGFEHWGRGERAVAPPLVVVVDGADLRGGGLADFLDGSVQLILVVRGASAPAPLTRLITPSALVIQTNDAGSLARLSSASGPAIVALVPDSAARFVHDPAGGKGAWQRLAVSFRPEPPRRALGMWSAAQQREELLALESLSMPPALGDASIESLTGNRDGDPVDRLASWLLTASGQAS